MTNHDVNAVIDSMRREAEARVAAASKRLDETRDARGTESRLAHEVWNAAEAYRQAVINVGHELRARLAREAA